VNWHSAFKQCVASDSEIMVAHTRSENAILSSPAQRLVEERVGKLPFRGRHHRLPRRLSDDYIVTAKVLGSGMSGDVRLAHSRTRQQPAAVKTLRLSNCPSEILASEVQIFLCMDHPHVVRLFDVYEYDDHLDLVMECMQGGELLDEVNRLGKFKEAHAAEVTRQMLLVLNYLHSHGVVHRDLKPQNFLYDRKGSNHLKLVDFGLSKFRGQRERMHTTCGTMAYIAPEVLERNYSSQCDMWSLGVMVFVLLSGYLPFKDTGDKKLQRRIMKQGRYSFDPKRWSNISSEAMDFTKCLLQPDTGRRLSIQKSFEHPWIQKSLMKPDESVVVSASEALLSFCQRPPMQRVCMSMMAWVLSNEETAAVRDSFLMLDTNHDGVIELEDLEDLMVHKISVPRDEASDCIRALDSTGSESIHFSDFLAAMLSSRIAMRDDLVAVAFQRFDTECSGKITADNLREVIGDEFGGKDVEELISEVSTSSGGTITRPQLAAYVQGTSVGGRTSSLKVPPCAVKFKPKMNHQKCCSVQ